MGKSVACFPESGDEIAADWLNSWLLICIIEAKDEWPQASASMQRPIRRIGINESSARFVYANWIANRPAIKPFPIFKKNKSFEKENNLKKWLDKFQ